MIDELIPDLGQDAQGGDVFVAVLRNRFARAVDHLKAVPTDGEDVLSLGHRRDDKPIFDLATRLGGRWKFKAENAGPAVSIPDALSRTLGENLHDLSGDVQAIEAALNDLQAGSCHIDGKVQPLEGDTWGCQAADTGFDDLEPLVWKILGGHGRSPRVDTAQTIASPS